MDNKKQKFKDDIEIAERNILIFSWVGVIVTVAFIVHTLKCLI